MQSRLRRLFRSLATLAPVVGLLLAGGASANWR